MRPLQPLTTLRTATPSISCSLQSSLSVTLSVRTVKSQSDADFRSLLLRLRSGEITDEWGLLLSRSPNKANNGHLFDTAVRLFYDRLTVFQYNQDRLKALGRPIARSNAIHSSPTAAVAQADDTGRTGTSALSVRRCSRHADSKPLQ